MDLAWATPIVEENYQAILSEAGGLFDRDFIERWVAENGEGFFLRDKSSSLDCNLFTKENFNQLYLFKDHSEVAVFRLVEKRNYPSE